MFKRGATRTTLLIGRYAIKFPSFRNGVLYFIYGMLGNYLEWTHWRHSKHAHLGHIYYCAPFGLFQIMKRYTQYVERKLTADEIALFPFINVDNNGHNAALDGDTLVLFDYGNSSMYYEVSYINQEMKW